MKRRGGSLPKEARKDTVFKKVKASASASPSSSKRTSKVSKHDKKAEPQEENGDYDDDLLGGDSLFADSAIDARKPKEMPDSDSDSEEENVDEAKLRQGKAYLQRIMKRGDDDDSGSDNDSEMDVDKVTARLAEEALQSTGKMSERKKADSLKGIKGAALETRVLRGTKQPVTAVRISDDEKTIYSASKDCCIVKWDVASGDRLAVYRGKKGRKEEEKLPGHDGHVLSLALSSDGKFLASGGRDKLIYVWDTEKDVLRDAFKGHKDSVTALTFRIGSHDLYSGSDDRTLKLWNIDDMAYLDTLFGHKAEITAIDALARERPVTSSMDKTAAVWKVTDEVHLEYLGPKTHLFSIALLTEDIFVTGGQDGAIHLWSTQKRKPLFSFPLAHGHPPKDAFNWITSLGALRYSDLFASGSATGEIRLWKLSESKDSFSLVTQLPQIGVINSLQFSKSGQYLVAGVGQEPRMGRWIRIAAARNSTVIFKLNL